MVACRSWVLVLVLMTEVAPHWPENSSVPMHLAPEECNHLPRPGVMRRAQRVKRLSMEERFQPLTNDDYVLGFNEVEVKSSGCEGVIELDRRDD